MDAIVKSYFVLRKAFPKMSPSSAWFHASVQAECIIVNNEFWMVS